jgi:hypothetical protein
MGEKQIRLITRGDDCGSNKTANQAILEAVERGILKNVSLMAVCEAIEDAAVLFAGRKDVCFGIHSTITAEWDHVRWGSILPASQVASLVDHRGHFFQTVEELGKNVPKLEEVMAELQAQLELLRKLGFHITYADEHMGFRSVIQDFDVTFDQWCKREGLINYHPFLNRLPHGDKSVGDPVDHFIRDLSLADSGQYLIVGHPAYDNEEMRLLGHDGYSGEQVAVGRHWERLIYTDSRVINFFQNGSVVPIRYDEAVS